jgi:hypothetical protein
VRLAQRGVGLVGGRERDVLGQAHLAVGRGGPDAVRLQAVACRVELSKKMRARKQPVTNACF